jgi:glycosyltransferase involved in cell wall biosynthesis
VREVQPDFVYLNSMFSLAFTIFPMLMLRFGQLSATVVLAPRGMLHAGVLQYKTLKKKVFLSALRLLRIPNLLRYHATDAQEAADIRTHLHTRNGPVVVANFPNTQQPAWQPAAKEPEQIRLVFLSRISRNKNLDFLLNLLKNHPYTVRLEVYGSFEEQPYQHHCEALAAALPAHIQVLFRGNIPHDQVSEAMRQAHLYVLPTLSENFGHSIFEALQRGKPVLISDNTPWRDLAAQRIGWDLPLSDPDAWLHALHTAAQMTQAEYDTWSQAAWNYAREVADSKTLLPAYLQLFS